MFNRALKKSQENLNQQLASRGLLNSGAAIQAQSELIQDMTQKEMQRQTGLQRDLAEFGFEATGQQQALMADQARTEIASISESAGLRAGLEQATARDIANVATSSTSQQAQIQTQLAQNLATAQQQTAQQEAQIRTQTAQGLAAAQTGTAQQQALLEAQAGRNLAEQQTTTAQQTAQLQDASGRNIANVATTTAAQKAALDAQTAQNIAGVATGTAQAQAQVQTQLSQNLAQISQLNTEQKVELLKSMGLADAGFTAQSAQDLIAVDKMLAQNVIQEGMARGDISQQQAQSFLNQGQQSADILGNLASNVSNIGQTAATTVLNAERQDQQTGLGLQQEGLRGALSTYQNLNERLSNIELDEFGAQYGINRASQDALQNMELGLATNQANALNLQARNEREDAQGYKDTFNSAIEALGSYSGGSKGSKVGTTTTKSPKPAWQTPPITPEK